MRCSTVTLNDTQDGTLGSEVARTDQLPKNIKLLSVVKSGNVGILRNAEHTVHANKGIGIIELSIGCRVSIDRFK